MNDGSLGMRVGQVIEMLSQFNPNDDLLIFSSSHKIGHITGLDHEMMRQKGAVVITYDFDEVIRERLTIQQNIDKQIEQLEQLKHEVDRKAINARLEKEKEKTAKIKAKAKAKPKKKPGKYEKKSLEDLLCEGLIPTGRVGRPRKINVEQLSPTLQAKFKPSIIKRMVPSELFAFIDQINNEIKEKHL